MLLVVLDIFVFLLAGMAKGMVCFLFVLILAYNTIILNTICERFNYRGSGLFMVDFYFFCRFWKGSVCVCVFVFCGMI